MSKLSRYEKVVLGLGLAFLLLVGGYRLGGGAGGRPYQVSVTRADQPAAASLSAGDSSRPDSLMDGERIDLNTAGYYDLMRLPGIGEKRARSILDWREKNGGFSAPEQLTEISGIGEKTLEKLLPYIEVSG
mgnify:FL=1